MGLEEKRAIKAAEDGWIKVRQAEVAELCGASIPYAFDWPSFDLKSIQWLEHNGPHQVNVALRQICRDELGREAVRAAVKQIAFGCVARAEDKRVVLADGLLQIAGNYGLGIDGTVREAEIVAALLPQL